MTTTSPTLAPGDLARSITAAWADTLTRSARPAAPHPHVYASSYRTCARRMVLELTRPQDQPAWPAEVLAKFRRGDDRERDLLIDLTRIGRDADPPFAVIGQQERFELRDHKSRVAIVGKVDARVKFGGDLSVPLEVKAWSPMMVDRIQTFADLFEQPWTRGGAYQLLAYLFGAGVPFGFLMLDRSGIPAVLPVELDAHLDRMEEFLARAEHVLDHRDAGTLPDYLVGDANECQRCPFYGSVCNPPLSSAGTTVLTDPELEALLVEREALDAAATAFDRIDKDIKKRLRGIESAIAGPFLIQGTWGKQSRVELPADLKAQYTRVDPQGRFTLTVTRMA